MPSILNATTTSGLVTSADNSGSLQLQTNNGTTAVTIDTSQKVGIGTASPTQTLDVNGSILAANSMTIGFGGLYQAGSMYSDSNWGMIFRAKQASPALADFMWANSAGTERMRITSGGDVGIGTSSPTRRLEITGSSDSNALIQVNSSLTTAQSILGVTSGSDTGFVGTISNHNFVFRTNNTERMRIDSSGNLLVGTTDSALTSGVGVKFVASSTTPYMGYVINTSGGGSHYHLYNTNATNNGYRFYVNVNGGIANYSGNNTNLSDERTKENIELADSYLNKICSIPVKTFNYKDEPLGEQKTLGVIAQDVEAVAPELVNNEGFGETKEGEEPLKSIYTTDMMFAMMKAIQELKAELDATKAEVQALKGVA